MHMHWKDQIKKEVAEMPGQGASGCCSKMPGGRERWDQGAWSRWEAPPPWEENM